MLELQFMLGVGSEKEIRVIDHVAHNWEYVAIALGLHQDTINTLSRDHAGNAKQACCNMFSKWIDSCMEISWPHLIDALHRADFKALAKQIEHSKGLKCLI